MWLFRRCAISLLPRPPRAAPPPPYPSYPAPRFPTIPRAAKSLALVSPKYTVGGAGRPTRRSSRRRCTAQTRRPFCSPISTRAWFRCIMAAQLSGTPLDGISSHPNSYVFGFSTLPLEMRTHVLYPSTRTYVRISRRRDVYDHTKKGPEENHPTDHPC